MDWVIPLITAGAALGGAIIAGLYALRAQHITQQAESARHLRQLAYEAAMVEWRERLPMNKPVAAPEYYILQHLNWAEKICSVGGVQSISINDYRHFFRDKDVRLAEMRVFFETLYADSSNGDCAPDDQTT